MGAVVILASAVALAIQAAVVVVDPGAVVRFQIDPRQIVSGLTVADDRVADVRPSGGGWTMVSVAGLTPGVTRASVYGRDGTRWNLLIVVPKPK